MRLEYVYFWLIFICLSWFEVLSWLYFSLLQFWMCFDLVLDYLEIALCINPVTHTLSVYVCGESERERETWQCWCVVAKWCINIHLLRKKEKRQIRTLSVSREHALIAETAHASSCLADQISLVSSIHTSTQTDRVTRRPPRCTHHSASSPFLLPHKPPSRLFRKRGRQKEVNSWTL